jgi:hypothetical protein
MKKHYALLHPRIDGDVLFTYVNGFCVGFEIRVMQIETSVVEAIHAKFPFKEEMVKQVSSNPEAKVTVIQEDLSFDVFWTRYDNKIGNKARAEKLWNGLSVAQKQMALDYIKKYNAFLAEKGTAKLYPETYLNQKRFLTH